MELGKSWNDEGMGVGFSYEDIKERECVEAGP